MLQIQKQLMLKIKPLDSGAYVETCKAIVIGDLHLGMEEALKAKGVSLPKLQLHALKQKIAGMHKKTNPKKIILLGDLKQEFTKPSTQEKNEVSELIQFLAIQLKLKVIIVKGNHDNYVEGIKPSHLAETFDEYLDKKILFIHGHKLPTKQNLEKCSAIVMAHEHSAVSLKDELGIKHKFNAILQGKWKGKEIIVLPSISLFSSGTAVNETPRQLLLSPILKQCNLREFTAFAISEGTIKKIPKLKMLNER